MAKRFTDTDKWKRPWFRSLPETYRLFWIYLCDSCDHSGIWYVDFALASFMIGSQVDPDKAKELLGKQIVEIDGGARWFIKDFVSFQYGELKNKSAVHRSVVASLKKEGLLRVAKGLNRGDFTPKDKDKAKAKEKEKDKSVIPDDLKVNEPEIMDWLAYKRERGETYKLRGLGALWGALRRIPENRRKEAIDASMSCNYAGIFPPKGVVVNAKPQESPATRKSRLLGQMLCLTCRPPGKLEKTEDGIRCASCNVDHTMHFKKS